MIEGAESLVDGGQRGGTEVDEEVVRGPAEHEPSTGGQDGHPVAVLDVLHAVGGEDDRAPLVAQPPQSGDERGGGRRIETGRRLVEEADTRPGEDLAGDAGSLALTTAQRSDPDVAVVGQAEGVHGVVDRRVDVRGRPAWQTQRGRVAEGAPQRQLLMEDVVLRDVADGASRPTAGRVVIGDQLIASRSVVRR